VLRTLCKTRRAAGLCGLGRSAALSLLLLLGVSACSDSARPWALYNIKGHLPDLEFSLSAAGGRTLTQDDLRGHIALVFFGYASCPDICPTTMAQLTQVVRQLGDKARDVRIVFISVDPHRDTPEVLQAYVNAFNDQAIGLTGSQAQIASLARRYRVAYQIAQPKPGEEEYFYDVTHSRGVYIFDPQGRARLLASDSESFDALVADLSRLIDESHS